MICRRRRLLDDDACFLQKRADHFLLIRDAPVVRLSAGCDIRGCRGRADDAGHGSHFRGFSVMYCRMRCSMASDLTIRSW